MSVLRDISTALSWLTALPAHAHEDARPVRYFPLAGWVFGLTGLGIAFASEIVVRGELASLLVGLLVVFVWALLSGLLHWDGLGDAVDGIWGANDVEQRLEIMHDSRTGAFGVVAISLTLLAQVITVSAVYVSGDWWAILAAPVFGRLAASMALWSIEPARPDGLAAFLSGRESLGAWIIAFGTTGVLFVSTTPIHVVIAVVGLAFCIIVPRVLARPVRGITGDIIGASVLIVETIVLVVAALIAGV